MILDSISLTWTVVKVSAGEADSGASRWYVICCKSKALLDALTLF
jgi:hypothetical protein